MMQELTGEEVRDRAMEWYEAKIRAEVQGNKGKFLVIDIATGDYEMDADEVAALDRMIERKPGRRRRFMMRIGYRTAHAIGASLREAP